MFKTLNTQSDTIIQDSSDYRHWDFNPSYIPTKSSPQRDYADIIAKSSFVLCPKGAGASSIRLFETMQASRVPVIIADNWVPLPDVNFNDFAIVIPERNVYETDKIIRARAGEFEKLASEARRTWERICMPGRDAETLLRALIHLRQIRNPGREKFIHAIFPLIELQRLTFVTLRKWARALVLKLLSAARVKFPYAMNR